jgi:hypothetical protein
MADPGTTTVDSPLCLCEPRCAVPGRAELGPEEVGFEGGSLNRTVHCITCGRRGVVSKSTEPKRPGTFIRLTHLGQPRE